MKKSILKLIALICCFTLCAGILIACKGKDDGTATELPSADNGTTAPGGGSDTPGASQNPDDYPAMVVASRQEADEDGNIRVNYKIPEELISAYDSFAINVYHNDTNNNLLASTEIDASKIMATIKGAYGKLRLELVGSKAGAQNEVIGVNTVSVYAKEYNFASLNGTFPVVYFTLSLFSMDGESKQNFETANSNGKNIQFMADVPTFISLERVAAYNWDALPENVHPLPNTTYEKSISGDFHGMNVAMAEYIKELYEINPESKFHFYGVDNYPELIIKFFYAQGMGSGNFDATLISDGTATIAAFKNVFSGGDADSVYTTLAAEWATVKEKAKAGEENYFDGLTHGYEKYSILKDYAFVIANEQSNVKWWISRDLFTENAGTQGIKDIIADMKSNESETGDKIEVFGINDMLSNLSEADQTALKTLFHFDGEMFSAAEENGKKILVILGTSTAGEGNIEEYLALVKKLYGEEYQIYYKGHPGYLTGLNAEKLAMFEKYGITDIDGSIAAELILFYCPDVYLVGWSSTTYKAAQKDKILALFNETCESGLGKANTDGYGDTPDTFYTSMVHAAKHYVKIEYADGVTVKYYDVSADKILDVLP